MTPEDAVTESIRQALVHAFSLCEGIARKYSRAAAQEIRWAGMTYRKPNHLRTRRQRDPAAIRATRKPRGAR